MAASSLVVIAKPEQVDVKQKGNTWSSSALTVKQDAKGQAAGVFKLVQQAMQGQKPENILVPFTAITRENVSQFAK